MLLHLWYHVLPHLWRMWHHVHMKICPALFMSNRSGYCIKSLSLQPQIFFDCHRCDFVKLSVLMVVIEVLLAAMS